MAKIPMLIIKSMGNASSIVNSVFTIFFIPPALNDNLDSMQKTASLSLNETVCGTFIDGKPLYQKTLVFNGPFTKNMSEQAINHKITNADVIFVDYANSYFKSTSLGAYYGAGFQFGITGAGGVATEYLSFVSYVNKKSVYYRMGSSCGFDQVVITLKYTKTTD